MRDLRTAEETAFIEHLDAVCEDMVEDLWQKHWSRGEPLIIERDGITMLKHLDGRITPFIDRFRPQREEAC